MSVQHPSPQEASLSLGAFRSLFESMSPDVLHRTVSESVFHGSPDALGSFIAMANNHHECIVLRDGIPIAPETYSTLPYHRIASTTKTVTSFLAHRLEDDGIISLGNEVKRYFSDEELAIILPKLSVEDHRQLGNCTLRELLQHISGLKDYDYDYDQIRTLTRGSLLARTEGGMHKKHSFHYSNAGYELIGEIMEKVTGHPLHTLYHEHVFSPANVRARFADHQRQWFEIGGAAITALSTEKIMADAEPAFYVDHDQLCEDTLTIHASGGLLIQPHHHAQLMLHMGQQRTKSGELFFDIMMRCPDGAPYASGIQVERAADKKPNLHRFGHAGSITGAGTFAEYIRPNSSESRSGMAMGAFRIVTKPTEQFDVGIPRPDIMAEIRSRLRRSPNSDIRSIVLEMNADQTVARLNTEFPVLSAKDSHDAFRQTTLQSSLQHADAKNQESKSTGKMSWVEKMVAAKGPRGPGVAREV